MSRIFMPTMGSMSPFFPSFRRLRSSLASSRSASSALVQAWAELHEKELLDTFRYTVGSCQPHSKPFLTTRLFFESGVSQSIPAAEVFGGLR